MMGRQSPYQYKFFIKGFDLEKHIRKDHVLRRISEEVDFDFIYEEVKGCHGLNGHVSGNFRAILIKYFSTKILDMEDKTV